MASSCKHKSVITSEVRRIGLIGCGGTGGFLAEHLVRMITGFRLDCQLALIDGDTVTSDNIWRQNFMPHEIGQNKAEALALRLGGRFGTGIGCYPDFVSATCRSREMLQRKNTLVITATDTLASRGIVARWQPSLWLDVGNDKTYGQAVIGTTHDAANLRKVFWNWHRHKGYVTTLPDMAAINPTILKARSRRKRTGCGQMPFAEQGFGVNAMAAQAAAVLAKQAVVDGVVTTAAIYFNAACGRMLPREIDRNWFSNWRRK